MKRKISGLLVPVFIVLLIGAWCPAAMASEVLWQSYADGMARSKFEKKKVFLHFFADWCGACKVMEEKTFRDPEVIASLNESFISIRINVDQDRTTSNLFRIRALPDTFFIRENSEIIGHRPGYIPPPLLKAILKAILEEDSGQ
jgi:thiol:disulfide interchange protein